MPDRPAPRIRLRTDSDLDDCVRILTAVHANDGYPVNWPDDPAAWLSRQPMLAAWVAELDGRVVGHVVLSPSHPGDVASEQWSRREGVGTERTAMVHRLFVDPAARGHGVGGLLVAQAVREAQALGLHPVLEVVDSDSAAAALYERLGWELMATVEQEWHPGQTVVVRCYAAPTTAP